MEGKSLEDVLRGGVLEVVQCLHLGAEIADGLAAAHRAGIIHRDLKPANIMVSSAGTAKILDFGLAKPAPQESETALNLTSEGTLLGTAAYMSPEQAVGRRLDARSDIFSFGAVLYEMITGHRAFAAETRTAILAAILRDEPPPVSNFVQGIPNDLVKIIARCLRKIRRGVIRLSMMSSLR